MKTYLFLLSIITICMVQCRKPGTNKRTDTPGLPPGTQTRANTFGLATKNGFKPKLTMYEHSPPN